MRVSKKLLNPSLRKQIVESFIQVVSDMKTAQETKKFLKDFFTQTELELFAKRLSIAYWIKKGRTYQNIKENLKVSSATIAAVQEEMEKEGYKRALEKLIAEEWATKWAEKIKKIVRK